MKAFPKNIIIIVAFSISSIIAQAKVILPSFFTDNMVLQQKANVPFWGTSGKNVSVQVTTSWDNKTYKIKSNSIGRWELSLKTPIYGGPYTITINDGDVTVLNNILIGEVWLCSGQSNMEMALNGFGKIKNYETEVSNANYPEIRLLQAEHVNSVTPLTDLKVQHGGWQVCTPQTVDDFSATAYFFARKVYQETHIPIGLLHSSWGGTVAEAWMSKDALKKIPDFDDDIINLESHFARRATQIHFEADSKAWNTMLEKAERGKSGKWEAENFNDANWKTMKLPQFWENDALDAFDGIVWYRKQLNISEDMLGKDVQFAFFADDNDELWVNGTYIGATVGYNVLRNYTIPAGLLKATGNVISIRVTDTGGGGGIYGNESDLVLKAGNKSVSLAGDWKYALGVNYNELPPRPYLPQGQNMPTALYNAMIYPIIKLPIAGVIWYQGESNADRAHQYQTLFPMLIKDWREKFNNKDLPFLFVQLANYMKAKPEPGPSAWAELREAQLKTLMTVKNTGMIVATDIGEAGDIHPKNKQDVGYRLALIALAKVYGIKTHYSGPLYKSYSKNGNSIAITFSYNEGLKTSDNGVLKGFSIAGSDQVFHWADAKIENGIIIVSSKDVKEPISVRYNWADNPDGNLTNSSGLPASVFRTDDWQGITFGKK